MIVSRVIGGGVLALAAMAVAWPAAAQDGGAHDAGIEAAPRITITAGRAVDLVGDPRRAMRVVSTAPPPPPAPGQPAMGGPIGSLPTASPLAYSRRTSMFGPRLDPLNGTWRMHSGVDMAASMGTPIYATADGTVRHAGWHGGYGLLVVVDHPGGIETRYAHMSQVGARAGQRVRRGELIGYVGSTGRSTGPHLHYETRINGVPVDPHRTR